MGPEEARRLLQLVLDLGTLQLATGARSADVEEDMRSVASALGAPDTQILATFSTIAVTLAGGGLEPVTVMRLVHQRGPDYTRLAAAYSLMSDIREGKLGLDDALDRLTGISSLAPPYPRMAQFLAAGLSAAAVTVLFGGRPADVAATLAISLLAQPLVEAMTKMRILAFFQLAASTALTSLLAVALVGLGAPIEGGLVVAGSLLRFLPGAALVAGMRDLLEGAIVSGSARLAEAVLLGAGVATGASLSLAAGSLFDVDLNLSLSGPETRILGIQLLAAACACGLYAVELGIPRFALAPTALVGASGWLAYFALQGQIWASVATGVAAAIVGFLGGYLARRSSAPTALWVVPASLPLLPGLTLVQGLMTAGQSNDPSSVLAATIIGFALGVGAAGGDLIAQTVYHVDQRVVRPIVRPAAQAMYSSVDIISGRRTSRTHADADDSGDRDDSNDQDAQQREP